MDIIKIAQAASGGIVTCSGSDCTVCSVLEGVSNVYNFILGLSFAAAVLFLTFAGLVFVFGTGRKAFFQKAKIYARNVIVGFIFILVGWIAIHAVLFSTGYKNAGGWWQFSCTIEEGNSFQTVSLNNISSYANVADFIASGAAKGVVHGPVSEAVLGNQIATLKDGEQLTFYLVAIKKDTQEEILIPFIAGYKAENDIKIDQTIKILEQIAKDSSGSSISLLDSSGNPMSSAATASFLDQMISKFKEALQGYINSDGNFLGLNLFGSKKVDLDNLSDMDRDKAMGLLVQELNKISAENKNTTDLSQKILNNMSEVASQEAKMVVERSTTQQSESSSKTNTGGDRTDTKTTEDKWKNTQTTTQNTKQDPNYKKLPSTQGENPVGPKDNIDKIKDQSKDDQKICDYSKATNPVEEALIRIECKDQLRYNMIHRFVKTIHNTDFQGGFCEDCGEIAVNFSFPRELLDQLIMHESTHAGQFCLGLIDMSQPAKVEREACANQMGSLCREKHDENEGKGTDDYLMQEITCAGEKGKDGKAILCRQKPHITYKEVPAGTQDEEVRGYLSRWQTSVIPSGDLKCEAYDWPVKYALGPHGPQKQQDTTMGPYHYGAHACGEQRVLGLKGSENNDVKEIVKSQEDCKSKARPNLPKAMECENSGGGPIEIDFSKKSPGGM